MNDRHQKLRSQFIKGSYVFNQVTTILLNGCPAGNPEKQNLRHDEIINMYTNEAIKCTR